MEQQQNADNNVSTEEKIKDAARRVFTKKGYAATRTRDIAEEAGYNLALLNYYFRSKENLFNIIMLEQLQLFVHGIMDILDSAETTLFEKIEIVVAYYIDMLIDNPDLPVFVLTAINADPAQLANRVGITGNHLKLQVVEQWKAMLSDAPTLKVNPIHLLMNLLSLTIFPFASSPVFRYKLNVSADDFNKMMQERKLLIPQWIKAMLLQSGATLK